VEKALMEHLVNGEIQIFRNNVDSKGIIFELTIIMIGQSPDTKDHENKWYTIFIRDDNGSRMGEYNFVEYFLSSLAHWVEWHDTEQEAREKYNIYIEGRESGDIMRIARSFKLDDNR
jgi:hypothetical protein